MHTSYIYIYIIKQTNNQYIVLINIKIVNKIIKVDKLSLYTYLFIVTHQNY